MSQGGLVSGLAEPLLTDSTMSVSPTLEDSSSWPTSLSSLRFQKGEGAPSPLTFDASSNFLLCGPNIELSAEDVLGADFDRGKGTLTIHR